MFHEALEAAFVRPEALATSTAVASPLPHGARLATLDDTPVALPLCSQPRISADHQATLSWLLVRRGEWGALSARELRRLAVHVEIHDIPVTRTQLILIRRSLLHARFGPTELSLAHEASAELRQRYEGGERLLNLAREYDFPPVIVMRAILAARGLSREQAKRALAAPADELNARDAAHAREARSNDLLFGTAAEHEAALAPDVDGDARVRAALCRLLDACGVRYTVGGMRAPAGGAGGAGGAGYGATRFADLAAPQLGVQVDDVPIEHLEPQILLHSAAQLNGVRVHWCMVRPMHASSNDAPFVRHQVAKHVARFGAGLVVFSGGVSDGFDIPGCVAVGTSVSLLGDAVANIALAAAAAAALSSARPRSGDGHAAAASEHAMGVDAQLSPWLQARLVGPIRRPIFVSWARHLTSARARARRFAIMASCRPRWASSVCG